MSGEVLKFVTWGLAGLVCTGCLLLVLADLAFQDHLRLHGEVVYAKAVESESSYSVKVQTLAGDLEVPVTQAQYSRGLFSKFVEVELSVGRVSGIVYSRRLVEPRWLRR